MSKEVRGLGENWASSLGDPPLYKTESFSNI